MRVDRQPIAMLGARDVQAWRLLAAGAAECNPFFEPAFAGSAAGRVVRGPVWLLVVRDDERGDWAGCLPVSRGLGRRPWLRTWDHADGRLGTPLLARDRVVPAWRAILRHARRDPLVAELRLPRLGDVGPVAAGLREALELDGAALEAAKWRPGARRLDDGAPAPPDEERRRGRDDERGGDLDDVLGVGEMRDRAEADLAVVDRAGDVEALERFLDLAAGPDAVGERMFLAEVGLTYAADGRMRLQVVEADGAVVAMRLGLVAHDGAVHRVRTAVAKGAEGRRPAIERALDRACPPARPATVNVTVATRGDVRRRVRGALARTGAR